LFNKHWFLGVTFSIFISSCAELPPSDLIVASVGDESITKGEVEELASSLLLGLRSKKQGHAARLDYLQTLIDEQLLVREARAQGLDTTRSFGATYEKAISNRLIDIYRKRHLDPRVVVSEDEVRDRFLKEGLDRERSLSRIVVKTEDEALDLRQRLVQGADFAALAKSHSLEKSVADRGGKTGFINKLWSIRLHIPNQLFDDLAAGEISQPLESKDVYQLIRFTEERKADFTLYRQQVQSPIVREKTAIQKRALAEELAHEYGLHLDPEGMAFMIKQPPKSSSTQISPEDAMLPLYSYKRGVISVGDFIARCLELSVRPGLGDSLKVVRNAWQLVIPDLMFWEAALDQGYHEVPAMIHWEKRKEIELLLKALHQTVTDQVTITAEETKKVYIDNPKLFEEPMEIWIQEILLEDLDRATALRQRLDEGETIEALVHMSLRQGATETAGKMHLHSYEAAQYGDLVDSALGVEPGQLVGPVKAKVGYSVFRLLERSGGLVQPFEAVEKRVQAIIKFRKTDRIFNAMVDAVREKYTDQVQIFEDVLSQVSLPEEESALVGEGDSTGH
jgi:parvulin-like peptidyl-prolyl isomerase